MGIGKPWKIFPTNNDRTHGMESRQEGGWGPQDRTTCSTRPLVTHTHGTRFSEEKESRPFA